MLHAINTYAEVRQTKEEEEMAYQIEPGNVDEGELLSAKLKCLELANSMWRTPEASQVTADQIVTDATKFWNFLTADELPEFPSESGH